MNIVYKFIVYWTRMLSMEFTIAVDDVAVTRTNHDAVVSVHALILRQERARARSALFYVLLLPFVVSHSSSASKRFDNKNKEN